MADSCKCDHCDTRGPRRMRQVAPDGWLFLQAMDEETGEITIVYACTPFCALALWQSGPGKINLGDETITAESAFPHPEMLLANLKAG